MVELRTVREADLEAFRRLHNTYVGRNKPLDAVRDWYRDHPELLVGAYDDDLVGHCLGRPLSENEVELAGIAVAQSHRRQGIGTALLSAFEDRAVSSGFRRVSLGSAGGYVDEFYVENGYSPESVLVRDPEADPDQYHITEQRVEDGTRKLYVEARGFDPAFLAVVREDFGDPEAIYIMAKELDT